MKRKWAVAALVVALVAALLAVRHYRIEREKAELAAGLAASRVIEESFGRSNQLKVSTLSGRLSTTSRDAGWGGLLASSQSMVAPYSVDYFVDLGAMKPSAYAWDAQRKIFAIEAPDPMPAAPNIDEAAATVSQTGLYISREAAVRLARQASRQLGAKANERANDPKNLAAAREAARAALRANALAALKAAQLDVADVMVRFRSEGRTNDDVWDLTTRIEDVPARIDELNAKVWP